MAHAAQQQAVGVRMRKRRSFEIMAAGGLCVTESWIRGKLRLRHRCLADVRTLRLAGTDNEKISHLGSSLKNFVRLKSLDLSYNALVSVAGIEHLPMLEELDLYFNQIASLQDVMILCNLRNLRELDLRLNPLVKTRPDYRLYLVYALTRLRRLDDCPVRDRERRAAIVQFTSEAGLETRQESRSLSNTKRGSDLRVATVNRLTKMLSVLDSNDEAALNFVSRQNRPQKAPQQSETMSSAPQELQIQSNLHAFGKSPRSFSGPVMTTTERQREAILEGCDKATLLNEGKKINKLSKILGKINFTPDPRESMKGSHANALQTSTPSPTGPTILDDQILHPPTLSYRHTVQSNSTNITATGRPHKGHYRRPLELMLGLLTDHWADKKGQYQNRHFMTDAVKILSLMEDDVVNGEREVQMLRRAMDTLNAQSEERDREQRSAVQNLSAKLNQAHGTIENLNQQLKMILEQNVCLQKELIELKESLLSARSEIRTSASDDGL
ncbi:centrosomal protein of 72 kDa [Denticeps clupeoides]|uniref:centrosomal protein of 72 kDa n=1 Tax=Denticeps clupeoides TaxID=299321 RepID=UPI0010A37672|nr:centrosomal protein of 72 kDa [Denticeps clupeoides]